MGGRVSCDTNRSNEADNIFLSESIRLGFCSAIAIEDSFFPPSEEVAEPIDR